MQIAAEEAEAEAAAAEAAAIEAAAAGWTLDCLKKMILVSL